MNNISRLKDKYGELSVIVQDFYLFQINYGVKTGIAEFQSNSDFTSYMNKHNSIYALDDLYEEVINLLRKKFKNTHLKLDQQLINITACEVDQIVERYKFEHPIIYYYLNEVSQ